MELLDHLLMIQAQPPQEAHRTRPPPIHLHQMNTQGAHLTLLGALGPQQWVETHHPCPRGASAGGQEGWGGESRGRVRG